MNPAVQPLLTSRLEVTRGLAQYRTTTSSTSCSDDLFYNMRTSIHCPRE